MRGTAIALVSAVSGILLVPAVPLAAEEPPAAPTAVLESAPAGSVPAGTAVKLDSSRSTGPIVRHLWDLDGNGSFETDSGVVAIVKVTPRTAGALTVHLKVVGDRGQSAEAALPLTVTPAPRMAAAGDPVAAAAPAGDPSPADTTTKAPSGSGPGTPAAHGHHASGGGNAATGPTAGTADPGSGPAPPAPSGVPSAAGPSSTPPRPASDPAPAALAHVAHSPEALASVPIMVASNRIATPAARRSARAVRKAATVHAAASSGVTIKNFAFSPSSVSVHVGDTISWTNQDDAPHTATAKDGSFDTGILKKGKSGSHTFSKAGTIAYICSVHPNMHATVVVAAATATGSGGSGNSGSNPSTSSTPSNSGGLPHTGLDLAAVVLVAMVLMGSGTVLRRTVGRQS